MKKNSQPELHRQESTHPLTDHRDIHLGRDFLGGSSTFAIDVVFVKGGPIHE
jgi:hypothetical protein